MRLVRVLPLLAAVLLAGSASAQIVDVPPYRNIAGVNLIGIPFGFFSGEFERVVSPGFVLGAGGTYSDLVGVHENEGDTQYSVLDLKGKYYPAEESFNGFAVGLTVGVLHGRGSVYRYDQLGGNYDRQTKTAPTVGVILDYNWLLGKRKKLYVGTGIGAKRVFGVSSNDDSVLPPVFPYGRLQIGIAY